MHIVGVQMLFFPFFFLGPNTVLSIIGLIKGKDKTIPNPAQDWRDAKVDVIIPLLNEQRSITLCLTSLMRQTLKPRKILIVDDGSKDDSIRYVQAFAAVNHLDIQLIKRERSIGKYPTLKRQARELDSDVEFIMDADSYLESPDYLEKCVQELYTGVGIACVSGLIYPIHEPNRREMLNAPEIQNFLSVIPEAKEIIGMETGLWKRIRQGLSNQYRECVHRVVQNFIYKGQQDLFGSIIVTVACAIAYRREYLKQVFDEWEPLLGDDLTASDGSFLGFNFIKEGYRVVQIRTVVCRSQDPKVERLHKQVTLWYLGFLQALYFIRGLLIASPLKSFKRYLKRRKEKKMGYSEKRKIREAYRQKFGEEYTIKYGRPMGWVILMSVIEKVVFPIYLWTALVFAFWIPLAITLALECLFFSTTLVIVSKDLSKWRRVFYFFKGIFLAPLRYFLILYDLYIFLLFIAEFLILGRRDYRK